jgi:hypothetical protein
MTTEQTADADDELPDSDEFLDDEIQDDITDDTAEDDEAEGDPEEDEAEEVDYEGKKYKVPKELKDALLRQADYTRKTQEVAETRRAVIAQAQELQEQRMFHEASTQHMAKIARVDEVLSQYAGVNWQQLSAQDPQQAQQHWLAYQQAKDQRQVLAAELLNMGQLFEQRSGEQRQQMLDVGIKVLQQDIPNYAEVAPKLIEHGVKALGFDIDELSHISDPRVVKVLHKAYLYDQMQAAGKQPQAKKPVPQAPVPSIKGRSSGGAKLDLVRDAEKLTADEWARRRDAQIRAKNARR